MAVEAELKVADLSPEQIAKFSWWRCDQLYEKHESWGIGAKTSNIIAGSL